MLAAMTAQASTYYGFKIGGVGVNSDNCNNVTGSNITSGTVKYDLSTNTVTLTGVTISRTGKDNRAIYNESNPGLTVKLVGTNNLRAADAAPLRFERHTTVVATAGSTTTISGGSEGGVYVTNSSDLALEGYGSINITATGKGGIEGSSDSNSVRFLEGVNVTIQGGSSDLLDIWRVVFGGDSKVTLKATGSSDNPDMKNVRKVVFDEGQTVLKPIGASYSETAKSIVLNGVAVYNSDVMVSNDYVAIINSNNFPDANFRAYLLEKFSKGYITSLDVANTSTMNVSNRSISSLLGLAYFTALTSLDCSDNTLSTLNVTNHPRLTNLNCSGNRLTSLIVTSNSKLTKLQCEYNQLSTLDLSKNTALTTVYCYYNNIKGAGAESFVNNLPRRIATGTIRFTVVNDAGNSENNHLLIPQVEAAAAKCWNLQCTSVSSANPWSAYEGEVPIDAVHFPDANFRSWVSSNCDTYANGYLTSYETRVTSINVESKSITSLKGIEYFAELLTLKVANNSLTSLDVSQNTKLQYLDCTACNLESLDVTGCAALATLICTGNQLQQLNLAQNLALKELICDGNRLQQLNLKANTALQKLRCQENQLSSLLLSTQSMPQAATSAQAPIYCYDNRLEGEAIDRFIAALDNRPTRKTCYLFTRDSDGQSMTKTQVQASRAKGWWPMQISSGNYYDYEGEDDAIRGDINGDGSVDGNDVSALLEMVLAGGVSDEQTAVADINADGSVDGNDVSALLEMVLAGN